jgi:purine nucleosidase
MVLCGVALAGVALGQTKVTSSESTRQLVIIDTDIGDDLDDAFALGLALQSRELKILGIMTAWGNTPLRARLVGRFLEETRRHEIPIAVGIEKYPAKGKITFTQERYAERGSDGRWPGAVDFLLGEIRKHPDEITVIAIGPETNLGAAIQRDAEAFRKLKRVVLMGVTLYVMPLDSTQIRLQELERTRIFSRGTGLTDALALLYQQWAASVKQLTPTLFDAVAVAYAVRPELCPTTPLRLRVDDEGNTQVEEGEPNAEVCLRSDSDRFFEFYMPRILGENSSRE